MEELSLYKKKLRQSYLSKRNKMSIDDIRSKSISISTSIINSKEYMKAKQLFCFYPLGSEVNILSVANRGLKDGKTVCFPKVINKTIMKFYKIHSLKEFEKGTFNVMEPISKEEILTNSTTLMIVPGLVFDEEGYRIGYGGGYYDRYIMKSLALNNNLYTLGVCYQWQLVKHIQKNEYDQKLNCILNEHISKSDFPT